MMKELFHAIYRSRKYIPLTFILRSPAAFFAHPTLSFTWKTWWDSCHLPFSKQNWNILRTLCWFEGKLLLQWQRPGSFPVASCTLFLAASHETGQEGLPLSVVWCVWGVQRTDAQLGTWMTTGPCWSDQI